MYTNFDIIVAEYTNEVYTAHAIRIEHGRRHSYCFRNSDKGIAVQMDRTGRKVVFRIFGNFSRDETLSINADRLTRDTFDIVMHALNDEFEKRPMRRVYSAVRRCFSRKRKTALDMSICKYKIAMLGR